MNQAQAHRDCPLPELKRRRTKLLTQCKKIAYKHSKPLNIAVVGPPGCGKSAFLNTVFASFQDGIDASWKEIAKEGNYGRLGIQVTQRLRRFHKRDYLDINEKILMPTFLDMTGFEDQESELNRGLFKIILDGKLHVGETLRSVIECYENNGKDVNKLRDIYNRRTSNLVIDCIIVVCTLDPSGPLPLQLLKIIRETVNKQPRDISIFGVLTHADKVQLGQSAVKNRQDTFERHLGLIGTRLISITNYCRDYDRSKSYISSTIPSLDIPVLELMTQVLQHRRDDEETNCFKNFIICVSVIILILAILVLL